MVKFLKCYLLITFINILIIFIIFANSMNFVTKEKIIHSNNYVIESWFDLKGMEQFLEDLAKREDLTQKTFYIIGRDIRTFSDYNSKLNLLHSYGINVVEALPHRNGRDRNIKNYKALMKYQDNFDSFIIVTDLLHTKRAYYVTTKIFKDKNIGVIHYDIPDDYLDTRIHSKDDWYKYSESFKATIMEFISLIYTYIKY